MTFTFELHLLPALNALLSNIPVWNVVLTKSNFFSVSFVSFLFYQKDTNDTEKKLPLVKTTLPTGVFDSKALSASNLSAVGNGGSYDILGRSRI